MSADQKKKPLAELTNDEATARIIEAVLDVDKHVPDADSIFLLVVDCKGRVTAASNVPPPLVVRNLRRWIERNAGYETHPLPIKGKLPPDVH